jgi:16S rRNA (guanine527-N7)-methyltransferase
VVTLGGNKPRVHSFLLPGTDMQRTLITVDKVRQTPPAYPRKAGKVEQNPLQ